MPVDPHQQKMAAAASESGPNGPPIRRLRRWVIRLLFICTMAVAALLVLVLWANTAYNGYRLGRKASSLLSQNLLGRVSVGRVQWELRAVADLIVGTATPILLEDVHVDGPDGVEVIQVPRVRAALRLWPLIARARIEVTEVEVEGGHCTLASMPMPFAGQSLGLAAAFLSGKRSSPSTAESGGGVSIALSNVAIRGTRFRLRIGPTRFDLPRVNVNAWLRIEGSPVDGGMSLGGRLHVDRGTWQQNGLDIPLWGARSPDVRIEGQKLSVSQFVVIINGSPARVDGALFHLFDDDPVTIEANATVNKAGIAGTRLLGLPVGGPAEVKLQARGPVAEPRGTAHFGRAHVDLMGTRVEQLQGEATIDVAKMKLGLRRVSARVLGGRVEGRGRMDLTTAQWQARVESQGVDPGQLSAQLAGQLDGSVVLSGRLDATQTGLAVVDLSLRRRRGAGADLLPPELKISGSAHISPQIVDFAGVTLSAGPNRLQARGSINLDLLRSSLYLTLDMPRLGRWFEQQIGVAIIRSASGRLHIFGDYPRLRMRGDLKLRQVGHGQRRLDQLVARLSLDQGTLRLTQLVGEGYGGRLRGEAELRLFRGDLEHPRKRPLLRASLRAEKFDLKALGLGGYGTGLLSAQADLSGPVDAVTGTARIEVPELRVQGDSYVGVSARVGLLRDRISLYDLRLPRRRGGDLRARGELLHDGGLSLRVRSRRFPLAGIPGLGGAPLRGRLSGQVEISGKLADPRFAGEVELRDVTIRGARLGSGSIRLSPAPDAVKIAGHLLGGLVAVDGFALMRPRPSLHLKVDFERFPLHEVVPELAQLGVGQITGFTTGGLRFDLDGEKGVSWAAARLSQLEFSLRYRPLGQRSTRHISLANQDDILLTYSDERLHVVTARMVSSTPGHRAAQAEFSVGGFLAMASSDLTVRGNVPLGLAEFFFARRVQRISGIAHADVKLTGPFAALTGTGTLGLREVKVKLPTFDRLLEVPAGTLTLAPGKLELSRLTFRVGKQQLQAWGTLNLLPGSLIEPESVDLRLEGDVDMGLMQLAFPEQLSFARGEARVKLALEGPARDPRAVGELRVGRLELRPRGLGRVITLQQGRLSFSNYLLCLGGESVCEGGGSSCASYARSCRYSTPLRGTFDEGTVLAYGQARFDQRRLVDLDLRLKGSSIPQRSPNVYAAEFNADMRLLGDQQSLALDGTIDIVDGRYVREFDILKDMVVRPRTYEETVPFWRGWPVLEKMSLRLLLRSTGSVRVRNRNADLALAAAMSVSGTLSEPLVDGTVRVEEGRFTIPFLRGDYRVERGDITFQQGRSVEQARLDIVAETQYIDRSGTDYRIAMQLQGSLRRMRIRLSSQPHLDQGQILALLATGRTTDQWRLQASGPDETVAAAGVDTQVKELTGTLLGGMIADPLERAFGLDLIRLEIGTETVTAGACKNLGTALEVCGEGETNLLGGFGGKATANYKMHDYLRLMGRLERLSTRIEREQENQSRGRVELKFRLPIR